MKRGIGIYIGRKEVIVACLRSRGGVPILEKFAIESISEFSPASIEPSPPKKKSLWPTKKQAAREELSAEAVTIHRALQKVGALHSQVTAAFNPFHLVTRYFEMPPLPRREWTGAARYESSRYIPFKLSEVVSDYQIVPAKSIRGEDMLSVTVTAAKMDVLRSYVQHLRSGSARVDAVEPVYTAFTRAVALSETLDPEKAYGFVFLDADGSVNVTLVRAGVVYLSRDFILSDDRRANETRFHDELKMSFDFMRRTTGELQLEQLFLAGSGELEFWADFLSSVLGKEIHIQSGLFPTKQEIPKNMLCALLIPIGLALRGLKHLSPVGNLTLLRAAERETKPERLKRLIGIEFIGFAIFFILLRLALLEPYAAWLRAQMVRQIGPAAAGNESLAVQSVDELRKFQTNLEARVGELGQFSANRIYVAQMLKTLGASMPRSIWLEQIAYSGRGDERATLPDGTTGGGMRAARKLNLEGQCYLANAQEDVKAINGWAKALGEDQEFLKGFRSVTVAEVRREKYLGRDTSMFRIEVS